MSKKNDLIRKEVQLPLMHSQQTQNAYMLIDMCYYRINRINAILSTPRSALERLVDAVTGYSNDECKKWRAEVADALRTIIKAKKIIRADYSRDAKALQELIALGARSVATKERVPAKRNRPKGARRGPTAPRRNAQKH